MKRLDVEIDRSLNRLTLATATLNVLHWMNIPNQDYFDNVWKKALFDYQRMAKIKVALKSYK